MPTSAATQPTPDWIEIGGKRYLTQQGLARELKVCLRTVRRWDALRIGPPRITIGRVILFDPDKLPGWLASHEQPPVRAGRGRRRAA